MDSLIAEMVVCSDGCLITCRRCNRLVQLTESMTYSSYYCIGCQAIDIIPGFKWPDMVNYHTTKKYLVTDCFNLLRLDIKVEIKELLLVLNRYGFIIPIEILNMIFEHLFGKRRNLGSLKSCLNQIIFNSTTFTCNDGEYEVCISLNDQTDNKYLIDIAVHDRTEYYPKYYPQTARGTFYCDSNGDICGDWPIISDRYGDGFDFHLKSLAVDLFVDDYRLYKECLKVLAEIRIVLIRNHIPKYYSNLILGYMYDLVSIDHTGDRFVGTPNYSL